MSLKHGTILKSEDTVKQWMPEEIMEEFVCTFVKYNNGTVSISIMLYLVYGESESF